RPGARRWVTPARPGRPADGDPQRPKILMGLEVIEQLRTRRDEPGALVALEDGRFGVSGPVLAGGPSGRRRPFARRRLANASSPGERAWWQEVVGALAR